MQNCYQFSGGTSIPENADMKSSQYLIPGNYYCDSIDKVLTLSNCPLNSAFLLKVEWSVGSNARYIRQTFIQYDNNKTISRVYFNDSSTWRDETQVITNADFVDLTLNSGIVNASSNSGGRNKLGYCKIGDIVYIAGGIGITNFSGNTTAVAQLPSGYRPATIHYYFAPLSGSRICRALVNPNGSIYVEWAKNINDGSNVTGKLTWIDLSTWFIVA